MSRAISSGAVVLRDDVLVSTGVRAIVSGAVVLLSGVRGVSRWLRGGEMILRCHQATIEILR